MNLFWREVYLSESMSDISGAKQALSDHGIESEIKTVNRNFHGLKARRTVLGAIGENLSLENQYYLLVRKQDKEEADYIIREWIRQKRK